MPSYSAPVRDMQFVLHELLNLEAHNNLPGFEEVSRDLVDAILEEGAKLNQEVLQPLNQSGDKQGCTLEGRRRSRRRRVSSRLTRPMWRAAGTGSSPIRNMAARACLTRSISP